MRNEPLDPEASQEFFDGVDEGTQVTLAPVLSGELFLRVVQYPVIVEMWEKRKSGRVKRAWLSKFTETERETIGRYQAKFYRWYLVSGTPQRVMIRPKTLELLQRAATFFATV